MVWQDPWASGRFTYLLRKKSLRLSACSLNFKQFCRCLLIFHNPCGLPANIGIIWLYFKISSNIWTSCNFMNFQQTTLAIFFRFLTNPGNLDKCLRVIVTSLIFRKVSLIKALSHFLQSFLSSIKLYELYAKFSNF